MRRQQPEAAEFRAQGQEQAQQIRSRAERERTVIIAEAQRAAAEASRERYEQALIDKTVDVLDASFWDSPHTLRYGATENLYGYAAIREFRAGRPAQGLARDVLKNGKRDIAVDRKLTMKFLGTPRYRYGVAELHHGQDPAAQDAPRGGVESHGRLRGRQHRLQIVLRAYLPDGLLVLEGVDRPPDGLWGLQDERQSREQGGRPMSDRLADELMAAFRKEGKAMSTRDNTHRMADANKAFAHFAW